MQALKKSVVCSPGALAKIFLTLLLLTLLLLTLFLLLFLLLLLYLSPCQHAKQGCSNASPKYIRKTLKIS